MWILGDLSEPEVLTDLLALCGVEIRRAAAVRLPEDRTPPRDPVDSGGARALLPAMR
jgi:hypothetical protein